MKRHYHKLSLTQYSEERVWRAKVSFGRTMMRALELQRLAKRHISGQSDTEQ